MDTEATYSEIFNIDFRLSPLVESFLKFNMTPCISMLSEHRSTTKQREKAIPGHTKLPQISDILPLTRARSKCLWL